VNLSYQAHEHRASSRSEPFFGRCGTSIILPTYKTLRADPPVSSVSTPGIATSYLRDYRRPSRLPATQNRECLGELLCRDLLLLLPRQERTLLNSTDRT